MAALRKEYCKKRPIGYCVDIGAPKYVTGKHELNRILSRLGLQMPKAKVSVKVFCFGDETLQSLGRITSPLQTTDGVRSIMVDFYIVQADAPAFLGMDVQDRENS